MKSNFITVLNHIDGEVYQHALPFEFRDRAYLSEIENWLIDNGYNLGNVEWMVHEYPVVQIGCPNRNLKECECEQCCGNTN